MGYQFFLPMVLCWRASRAKAPPLRANFHKNQTKSNFFGKAWKLNFGPLLHIASHWQECSFLVGKGREPQSINTKLFLPIMPIGIVAYAFTLLWDNLCRNSCIIQILSLFDLQHPGFGNCFFPCIFSGRFSTRQVWRKTVTAKCWSIDAYVYIVCITVCAICVLWFSKQ